MTVLIVIGRRRKIKCQRNRKGGKCAHCRSRGSECISQEVTPSRLPGEETHDSELADRLVRLEAEVKLLRERKSNSPTDTTCETRSQNAPQQSPQSSQKGISPSNEPQRDLLGMSAIRNAQNITEFDTISSSVGLSLSTYDSDPSLATVAQDRQQQIRTCLYELLPNLETRQILAEKSPGMVLASELFPYYSRYDCNTGFLSVPGSHLSLSPDASPVLLAKSLLISCMCLQHLSPSFDVSSLDLKSRQPCQIMSLWVGTVTNLVLSNDQLIACFEGLECLVLHSFLLGDGGHLRKAWMVSRRALNMADLMGVGSRSLSSSIRFTQALEKDMTRTAVRHLWHRINASDRYLSLILGLPVGSSRTTVASSVDFEDHVEKLQVSLSSIAGEISKRNESLMESTDAMDPTKPLEAKLRDAATAVSVSWWSIPNFEQALQSGTPETICVAESNLRVQVQFFTLHILLYLPFILHRSGQAGQIQDRISCAQNSREVLYRFLSFRTPYSVELVGRQIDYPAVIAARTLVLSHIGFRSDLYQRRDDLTLIQSVLNLFEVMAARFENEFSKECVSSIQQLLPIMTRHEESSTADSDVRIKVPNFGVVSIMPASENPPDVLHSSQSSLQPDMSALRTPSDIMMDTEHNQTLDTTIDFARPHGWIQIEPDAPNYGSLDNWIGTDFSQGPWATNETVFQGLDASYWSTLMLGLGQ